MVSISALRFPKQYQDAGLKAKLPLIGGGTTFDEFVLPSLGDEAIGGISAAHLQRGPRHAGQQEFVKEYRTKYSKMPSYYSETCYTSARWINEAAKAIGGDVEDREKFLAALKKVEIPDAPRGPHQARRLRQPDPEHLRPQGRAEGRRALEHRHPHLPRRLPVLEVQARGVPEAARVRPQLSALQVLLR